MPTLVNTENGVEEIDVLDLFPPMEGELNLYYGKIRNGKNYTCTVDILKRLKKGSVEYVNWNIDWQGYDQRDIWYYRILGVLGLKRTFYKFPKGNLRFYKFDANFWEWLASRNDCVINVDEAYIPFDSYKLTKLSLKDRLTVLSTGHYNRTINVISQRASGIHVVMRANVNRFFKIEKVFNGFWLIPPRFQKTEIQDMMAEMPDESKDPETGEYLHAESIERYWGKKKYFKIYDTKYLRGDMPTSQPNLTEIHQLKYPERVKMLWKKNTVRSDVKSVADELRSPTPRLNSTSVINLKSLRSGAEHVIGSNTYLDTE